MATDATGTPSTNFSFPKYNVAVDAPSGLGLNAIIDDIDSKLLSRFVQSASAKSTNQVPIWNGSAWTWGTIGSANITDGSITPTDMAAAGGNRRFLASDDSGNPLWQQGGMHLIQETVLSSPAGSIVFSSIPQTFRALQLRFFGRGTNVANNQDWIGMDTNGAPNWYGEQNYSSSAGAPGTALGAGEILNVAGTANRVLLCVNGGASSTLFSHGIIDLNNYTNTISNQQWMSQWTSPNTAAAGALYLGRSFAISSSTSAITSLTFTPPGATGNFATGTRIALYGIA